MPPPLPTPSPPAQSWPLWSRSSSLIGSFLPPQSGPRKTRVQSELSSSIPSHPRQPVHTIGLYLYCFLQQDEAGTSWAFVWSQRGTERTRIRQDWRENMFRELNCPMGGTWNVLWSSPGGTCLCKTAHLPSHLSCQAAAYAHIQGHAKLREVVRTAAPFCIHLLAHKCWSCCISMWVDRPCRICPASPSLTDMPMISSLYLYKSFTWVRDDNPHCKYYARILYRT